MIRVIRTLFISSLIIMDNPYQAGKTVSVICFLHIPFVYAQRLRVLGASAGYVLTPGTSAPSRTVVARCEMKFWIPIELSLSTHPSTNFGRGTG